MWLGCISIRRSARWSWRWTRRARCRLLTVRAGAADDAGRAGAADPRLRAARHRIAYYICYAPRRATLASPRRGTAKRGTTADADQLIPIGVPEARRLIAALLYEHHSDNEHTIAWSRFRRRRQCASAAMPLATKVNLSAAAVLGPARARSVLGLRRARALVLDRLAHRRLKVVSRAWRCPSRPRWTRSRHRCCSSGRLYRDAQSPPPYWHGSRRKVVAVSKLSTAAARAEAEASRRSRRRGPRRGPSGLARAGWPGGCPARRRRRE
jgi:hypothetical protein